MKTYKNSKVFPWYQTGYYIVTQSTPQNERAYFRRNNAGAIAYKNDDGQVYYNNQPWPVYIDEMRFYWENIQKLGYFSFSAQSSKYGRLWPDFILSTTLLNAPMARYLPGERETVMTLPSSILLSPEDVPLVSIYAASASCQLGILGFDPENKSPVVRCSDVLTVAGRGDFALVSDRDNDSRWMYADSLTFPAGVEIAIDWPNSPKWTDDPSTPGRFIQDQSGPNTEAQSAYYRPEKPYVLEPTDTFYLEVLSLRSGADALSGQDDGRIGCCLYGHQIVPEGYYG